MAKGKGFLTLATATILNAVSNGYTFGFDIVDITGMPGGTVYPALRRLEEAGYLTSEWEKERVAQAELRPRRKYYEMTRAGRQALAEAMKRYRLLEQTQLAQHARAEVVSRLSVADVPAVPLPRLLVAAAPRADCAHRRHRAAPPARRLAGGVGGRAAVPRTPPGRLGSPRPDARNGICCGAARAPSGTRSGCSDNDGRTKWCRTFDSGCACC